MTDLKKGIIELDRITITRNTTREELANAYQDILNPYSSSRILDINTVFHIEGQPFICLFHFTEAGNVHSLQLIPVIDYKSEKDDRTGRQEERRQACDKWMFEKLGIPHKESTNVTLYNYPNVEVYSISHFDLREGADAGHIIVKYLH